MTEATTIVLPLMILEAATNLVQDYLLLVVSVISQCYIHNTTIIIILVIIILLIIGVLQYLGIFTQDSCIVQYDNFTTLVTQVRLKSLIKCIFHVKYSFAYYYRCLLVLLGQGCLRAGQRSIL